jgi:hypothetical protein
MENVLLRRGLEPASQVSYIYIYIFMFAIFRQRIPEQKRTRKHHQLRPPVLRCPENAPVVHPY